MIRRRQVTVLFTDLAGFTPMAEKLEVHRFEGTVNQ